MSANVQRLARCTHLVRVKVEVALLQSTVGVLV